MSTWYLKYFTHEEEEASNVWANGEKTVSCENLAFYKRNAE